MAIIQLQLRQGPETQRTQITPLEGEVIYITDTKMLYVGDGVTAGGSVPRVPMPAAGTSDNSSHPASTRFVQSVLQNVTGTNLSAYARRDADNLFVEDNTFQKHVTITAAQLPITEDSQRVATTAWVKDVVAGITTSPIQNAAIRNAANTFTAQNDFTVSPTAPTPAINDSSTRVATTQFVRNAMNAAGLGVSTVVITAGTGASVNYSAGQVTLPNGNTVSVSAGTVTFAANGTFYVVVDATGAVTSQTTYPTGSDRRTIATVTTSSGSLTSIDLGGADLSAYARLNGATFTGMVRAPNPASTADDTTLATTQWVNDRIQTGGDLNLVRENTPNTYTAGNLQDFKAASIEVPNQPNTDNSNRAASTAFVKQVVANAIAGGVNEDTLEGYARLTGATFTGITRGPTPTKSAFGTEYVTAAWIRDVLDDIFEGGDQFPALTARPNTRIIDHTGGRMRLPTTASPFQNVASGDIEIPANSTVWIYVDPTVGVNHYPFTNVNTFPPTGRAFAYATTNSTSVTNITFLKPETIFRDLITIRDTLRVLGDTQLHGDLVVGGNGTLDLRGNLNTVGNISTTGTINATGNINTSADITANDIGLSGHLHANTLGVASNGNIVGNLAVGGNLTIGGGATIPSAPGVATNAEVVNAWWVRSLVNQVVPIGSLIGWPSPHDPSSWGVAWGLQWTLCDGRALPKASYASLYGMIGGIYGETSTTFNVPNLIGRFPLGAFPAGGRPLGGIGGAHVVTLTANEMPPHQHSTDLSHHHRVGIKRRSINDQGSGAWIVQDIGHPYNDGAITPGGEFDESLTDDAPLVGQGGVRATTWAGAGLAHENMPPYLGINYAIRIA